MQDESLLHSAADSVSRPNYLSSKAELVEYYKDAYGKGWKQTLVRDLSAQTGLKPKSLERRFDPSRLDIQPRTAKAKAEYAQLGTTVPPTGRSPKGDSITVTVTGTQKTDKKGGTRSRTITATFTGTDAYKFVNAPSYRDIWLSAYDDNEDLADLFEDGDYAIDVGGVSAA